MIQERKHKTDGQFLALADNLLNIWIQAHGGEKATASVLEGHENLVAIVIHNAFTPAEIRLESMAKTRKLIGEYAKRLIGFIKPELVACVEIILGRSVTGYWMEPDVGDGTLLFLFRFNDDNS
jgi:hypothetical protein